MTETDALVELEKELKKSIQKLESKLCGPTQRPEEKKSQLKRAKKQLQQLTLLLYGVNPPAESTAGLSRVSSFDSLSTVTTSHDTSSPSQQQVQSLPVMSSSSSSSSAEMIDIHDNKDRNSDTKLKEKQIDEETHNNKGDDKIRNIVILVAMEQEAKPFLERHQLTENVPSPFEAGSPMVSYSGKVTSFCGEEISIHLIWNGRCKIHSCNLVATTTAGVATYAAIQVFQPDLVISAGTAGGFSELGARIGDVYISTKCIFHARRIPIFLPPSAGNRKLKGKYFEEYGFGHFRSPPMNKLAKCIGIKQGIVSSSDCLDCSEIDLQLLRSEGAVVKEMEAAAVAWVCQVLGKPFFAVKSITDIVDGSIDSEEEFYTNLNLASRNLQEKLTLVVTRLGGTSLEWGQYSSLGETVDSNTSPSNEKNHHEYDPSSGSSDRESIADDGTMFSLKIRKDYAIQGMSFAIACGILGACVSIYKRYNR